MKVIVPCCGRSSRFPDQPPKWMLPSHDGRPMLVQTLAGIPVEPGDVVVTILAEHERAFSVRAGLEAAFGHPVHTVVLDERTANQPETVARTLESLRLDEPFLVKDSDNSFVLDRLDGETNYVCVDSLNNHDAINPRNKSYLQVDHNLAVTNIREKVVISDLFSVGGYAFLRPDLFLQAFGRLSADVAEWDRELYTSDVIGALILDGQPFKARPVSQYQDWGTLHEWRRSLLNRGAYFVSLDGFVFDRGSQHFAPRFADVEPNPEAVAAIRELSDRGHSVIYLSIRPPSAAELTTRQLRAAGLPTTQVVYGCPIASWHLLTSPHPTLPFQTGHALEVSSDDPNLVEKLVDARW